MKLRHPLLAGAGGLAVALTLAMPAGAHVYPTVTEAAAGSFVLFDLVVPHGCEEAGTTRIEVQIPEGIYSATPEVVPGWTISQATEALDEPVDDGHGGQHTERDATVTWEGGPLAPDQLQQFGLSVQVPDTPGETILFPVIQTCEGGASTEWIQPTVEGEDEPEHPAPAITLTESEDEGHGHGGEEEEATDEEAEHDEETAAETTPESDDDDDGPEAIAIAGLVAGLLGLALGGTAFVRSGKST